MYGKFLCCSPPGEPGVCRFRDRPRLFLVKHKLGNAMVSSYLTSLVPPVTRARPPGVRAGKRPDRPGAACRGPEWGVFAARPRCSLQRPGHADANDGCAGSEQDFGRHNCPGKLKTWKPDMLHGVAVRQNPRFSGFQIFTLTTGTGEGHPCRIPWADTHADFFIASLMTSEALSAAPCSDFAERCAYLCVTIGELCPSAFCTVNKL